MIIDNHVHVGWFRDGYHRPTDIWNDALQAGVDEICVSSTSTCAELYDLVVEEMLELKNIAGCKVHPILWLTPHLLASNALSKMLATDFLWEGVKIHPKAHPEWAEDRQLTRKAAELASAMKVPLLVHTDEDHVGNANTYEYLYEDFPKQLFILAHGRPIEQILRLLPIYPNIVVDTAFMDIKHIRKLADKGYAHRMVFGTDVPVNKLFFKKETSRYIKDCISNIEKRLNSEDANHILGATFYRKASMELFET